MRPEDQKDSQRQGQTEEEQEEHGDDADDSVTEPPQPAESMTVLTDDPGQCESEHTARGWRVGCLYVLKFYPKMQTDLNNPKLFAVSFWRAKPPRQGVLL